MTNEFFVAMGVMGIIVFFVILGMRALLYEPLKEHELIRRGLGGIAIFMILALFGFWWLDLVTIAASFVMFVIAGGAKWLGDYLFKSDDDDKPKPHPRRWVVNDVIEDEMKAYEKEWKKSVE